MLQIKWEKLPVCAYPEELKGVSFTDLNKDDLTFCYGIASDDENVLVHASTSSDNALNRGNFMRDMHIYIY